MNNLVKFFDKVKGYATYIEVAVIVLTGVFSAVVEISNKVENAVQKGGYGNVANSSKLSDSSENSENN